MLEEWPSDASSMTSDAMSTVSEGQLSGLATERRPRRARRGGYFDFVQINGSGWGPMRNWLEGHRRRPVLAMGQEHRLLAHACAATEASMRQAGWRMGFAPALPTEGDGRDATGAERSTSAGAFVAAPAHIGCEPLHGCVSWDASPVGATGRLAVGWVNVLGGIACISAYFWCGEGWSCRNQALMRRIIALKQDICCMWVLSADFNMEPEELHSHSLMRELGGVTIRHSSGTCVSGKAKVRKCYDYFVIDGRLKGSVESVTVLEDAGTAPHLPVRMRIRASAQGLLARIQVKPKALPVHKPIGCAREPPAWPPPPEEGASQAECDATWEKVADCMEQEVLGVHDLVGAAGARFSGRAQRPSWKLQAVRPRRRHNNPMASGDALLMRWAARRLAELWILWHAAWTQPLSEGATKQLVGLQKAFRRRARHMGVLKEEADPWRAAFIVVAEDALGDPAGLAWLGQLQRSARTAAAAAEGRDANKRRADRALMMREAGQGAAGHLHKMSKPPVVWRPCAATAQGASLAPRDAADHKAGQWGGVWRVDELDAQGGERPWELAAVDDEPPLPPLRGQDDACRSLCGAFREHTGIGIDLVHPWHWGWVSDQGMDSLLAFLDWVERAAIWPSQLSWLLYFLIPKAEGGERPIGVIATTVRIWEGLRAPIMREQAARLARDYDWATTGRSAEQAVWEQLVEDEGLDTTRRDPTAPAAATVLFDLVKCFDRLSLDQVWGWGLYWKVPKRWLRVVLLVFAFHRRLIIEGSCSRQLDTVTAIVAGSRFSCFILHLVLIGPSDRLLRLWPSISLAKYVDDMAVRVKGSIGSVTVDTPRIIDDVVEYMREMGLEVSRGVAGRTGGKTKVISTHSELRRRLHGPLRRRGVDAARAARNLGIDHGGGGARAATTSGRRWAGLRQRSRLVRGLRKAGARYTVKVVRRGLQPSLVYGAKCLGLTKGRIQWLRKEISASLPGKHLGRSTALRLALHGCDPLHECIAAPSVAWSAAVWEGRNADKLQRAWMRQMTTVGLRPAWRRVHGPCGACILHLKAIGWTWPRWDVFHSAEGLAMHLSEVCPRDVKEMAMADSDAAMWRQWTQQDEYKTLQPRTLVEPLQRVMRKKLTDDWTAECRHAAAAAPQNAMWPQARMHEAGVAESDRCQLCGERGTAHHRLHICRGHRAARIASPVAFQHIAEQANPDELLWTRGLRPDPSTAWSFRPVEESADVEWREGGEEREAIAFSGDVCTDGSLKSKWRLGGQAGWGAVVLNPAKHDGADEEEEEEAAFGHGIVLYGPLPVQLPVQRRILRAELWALWRVLLRAIPPLRIFIDNAAVVEGVGRGRLWCCQANRPHADVWRSIWRILEDIGMGPGGVEVVKCRSHTTQKARRGMSVEARRIAYGNDVADAFAKRGAESDELEVHRRRALDSAYEQVEAALHYIGVFSVKAKVDGEWKDVTPWPPRLARAAETPGGRGRRWRVPPEKPHVRQTTSHGAERCLLCQRTAATKSARRAFAWQECSGGVGGWFTSRAAREGQQSMRGHALRLTGPFIWCIRCGAHSRKQVRGLARQCRGAPASGQYAMMRRRLASGRDPLTGEACGSRPQRMTAEAWAERAALFASDPATLPPAKRQRLEEAVTADSAMADVGMEAEAPGIGGGTHGSGSGSGGAAAGGGSARRKRGDGGSGGAADVEDEAPGQRRRTEEPARASDGSGEAAGSSTTEQRNEVAEQVHGLEQRQREGNVRLRGSASSGDASRDSDAPSFKRRRLLGKQPQRAG